MLLSDVVEMNARRLPQKEALCFEGERITFSRLKDRVYSASNALLSLARPGDRVAILGENCHQYAEMYFAAPSAGLVLVPLNYRLAEREIAYVINDSGARVLIVLEDYVDRVQGVLRDIPDVEHFVCVGKTPQGMRDYEELISRFPSHKPDVAPHEDDVAWFIYTSGTTGFPKGAMITHKNVVSKFQNLMLSGNTAPDEISLFNFPLFHIAGSVALSQLYAGSTVHLIKKFDPQQVLSIIEREKINSTGFAPTMFNFLMRHPAIDKYYTGTLKRIGYGASPMPVELLREGMERFGKVFNQLYGLTESTGTVTSLEAVDHVVEGPEEQVRRLASCGKELMNVWVRVVDVEGNDVEPGGQMGEIVVKGDNVMKGYWNKPEATAETIVDGWLHTGDMAWVDDEGYLFITDRRKDMILSGGENIYPREIEEVIYRHPSVMEAAVIGYPDKVWGESVRAIIKLKEGHSATEEEIIELCRMNLAGYKKPRSVLFLQEELPKNPTGKILKKVLREKYGKP
jgi:acyl-CoA synthetase (AMP-forming)/AMP-acid ligase II